MKHLHDIVEKKPDPFFDKEWFKEYMNTPIMPYQQTYIDNVTLNAEDIRRARDQMYYVGPRTNRPTYNDRRDAEIEYLRGEIRLLRQDLDRARGLR